MSKFNNSVNVVLIKNKKIALTLKNSVNFFLTTFK